MSPELPRASNSVLCHAGSMARPPRSSALPHPSGPSPAIVALRRAYLTARSAVEADLQESGFTLAQLEVLKVLLPPGGPVTVDQRALQESLHVTSATLTRLLAGMEGRRLIERKPHPTDSRGKQVSATAHAQDLYTSLMTEREAALNARLLAGFSDHEVQTLCDLLNRLAENMRG